jgi:hypothetical protein
MQCPECGGGVITKEMWGWLDPATGKYVRRLLGFRIDTLLISLTMFAPGILYALFYLVALPGYLVWRLFTFSRYSVRRTEFICEECGYAWELDR